MKTLYFECNMGAAGDMLMAALLELIEDKQSFLDEINHAGIPGVRVSYAPANEHGICGTGITVAIGDGEEECHDVSEISKDGYKGGHHHHHSGLGDVTSLIQSLRVPEQAKKHAIAVYGLIAEAEAEVHGCSVSDVHFHEVGALDAIADILGVCMLMERLAPEFVVVSPIHVGYGHVKCAHGLLPVPAPATAFLLRGIPTYSAQIQGELCTPTAAALLRYFAQEFGRQPAMQVDGIGYGMGKKKFPVASFVRAFIGEQDIQQDGQVAEVSCNIDDMTGEALGYAQEILMDAGALDVFVIPIQMKKSRPGQLLCCICDVRDTQKIAELMLRHTTTFGVRTTLHSRFYLEREMRQVDTPYGSISMKYGVRGDIRKSKPEYEDVRKIALQNGVSIQEVMQSIPYQKEQ